MLFRRYWCAQEWSGRGVSACTSTHSFCTEVLAVIPQKPNGDSSLLLNTLASLTKPAPSNFSVYQIFSVRNFYEVRTENRDNIWWVHKFPSSRFPATSLLSKEEQHIMVPQNKKAGTVQWNLTFRMNLSPMSTQRWWHDRLCRQDN